MARSLIQRIERAELLVQQSSGEVRTGLEPFYELMRCYEALTKGEPLDSFPDELIREAKELKIKVWGDV